MFIVHVAVPVPLRQLFSYTCQQHVLPCTRVTVPFGSRELVGIVLDCESSTQGIDQDKLKPVSGILDQQPLIPNECSRLAQWLADYYHFPIGEAFSALLPTWLRNTKTDAELSGLISETVFALSDEGLAALKEQRVSREQQKELMQWLLTGPKTRAQIKQRDYTSRVSALKTKGWVESVNQIPESGTLWQSNLQLGAKPTANREQGVAIGVLNASQDVFSISLLEGVTGSGKTEVYLQVIEQVLLNGKQALVLVPEIGLTPQTVERFEKRFNCEIGVLNSNVSNKKRAEIWLKARLGSLPIVIGTRSAVFTPFHKLGFIVIDEEHDDALKQQDGLRYHARDVAAIRAQRNNIPLLLGSATPSLESLNNALSGRYRHIHLTARAAKAESVSQHVLDLKHQPLHSGLSEAVIQRMRQHLGRGSQVLVFLNRRGFSPVLMCHDCGHVEECHKCGSPMTWHKQQRRMHCHKCEIQRVVPRACMQCGSHNIVPEGVGTEQLEETIEQLFPHYQSARIDRDNTRRKDAFSRLFTDIKTGKTKILIGTQMLAKGHHFPDVTLVVIVDVDGGLFSMDVRAQEKLAQLVTQLSGRAGRAAKKGEMVLQTHHPDHPILQELINNGYSHVARLLLAERKALGGPPFYPQAVIRSESVDSKLCQQVLQDTRHALLEQEVVTVIGPMPALIEKRSNRYRFIMILRAPTRRALHKQLHRAVCHLESDKYAKKLRWSVDVDAIDLT